MKHSVQSEVLAGSFDRRYNTMRIVVAAVSSNRAMSGVSRHAANLVNGLLTRSEVSALHLLVAPWEHKYVCESISRADSGSMSTQCNCGPAPCTEICGTTAPFPRLQNNYGQTSCILPIRRSFMLPRFHALWS